MCGVFGVLNRGGALQVDFNELAELNVERGNRGFGVLAIGMTRTDEYAVFRKSEGYTKPLSLRTFGGQFDNYIARAYLGHLRAPTGADASIVTAHPIQFGRFLLAHNGILLNTQELVEARGWYVPGVNVDSASIVAGIVHHVEAGVSVPQAIGEVAERCEGQQACWLYDLATAKTYLWRVMSPIHVRKTDGAVAFSSKAFTLNTSVLGRDEEESLHQGTVYCIDRDCNLTTQGQFKYETPYLLKEDTDAGEQSKA